MPKRKPSAHFAKQAQEAYELSLSGLSYRQIAEEMGVSLATVQRRLELYIKERVHPKADEYRARQIDSLHMYLRALRKPIESGDPKAIANAVRIQERIAKLLGLDSATAFKVEVEKFDDKLEVLRIMDHFFGENGYTDPRLKADLAEGERRQAAGLPPQPPRDRIRRPMVIQGTATTSTSAPLPDEFAKDNTFQPHEVQAEEISFADDVEEFEPVKAEPSNFKPRRGRARPNPASRFLVDSDD
ncbi:sigma factor-like helix-turn-helix DNA-binding protein [Streptomyces tendae]